MKKLIIIMLAFIIGQAYAQKLTAVDILKKIDHNLVIDQAELKTKMIIYSRSGSRTIEARSWVKGKDKSFIEYLKPPREKGKRMLKIKDKIWTYTPEPTDRIITISGHLLRQSVMGSDLSYEDITENSRLLDNYNAKIVGEEKVHDTDCIVLDLVSKKEGVTYYQRKLWVDKKHWLPLVEERFAKSGRLLKKTEMFDYYRLKDRWYPKKITFKDMLSSGKGTEYIIDSINMDVKIPDKKFTKAALRR